MSTRVPCVGVLLSYSCDGRNDRYRAQDGVELSREALMAAKSQNRYRDMSLALHERCVSSIGSCTQSGARALSLSRVSWYLVVVHE